ncbi:MAG: transposase family protein [Elusimicrobiota bacterium]
MKKRYPIPPEVEKQLLAISPSTIERGLKNKKRKLKRKIYGTTKPGYLLKHQIPIKTDSWNVHKPGFTETDLVSHSGDKADGDFIHSCNLTDIKTTWTETRAIMGKGQFETFTALQKIINSFPFPIKGIDSDNGSEFINWHLAKFCNDNKIQFTRSRPYEKNDNGHIEQKNYTHVRKMFGYFRYDTEQAKMSMNNLYKNELRLVQNLFQPSVKLIKKTQVGSKFKRRYDKPLTPSQRLANCKGVNPYKLAQLNKLVNTLDPFELSEIIDKNISRICRLRTVRIKILKTFEARFYNEIKTDLAQHKYTNL